MRKTTRLSVSEFTESFYNFLASTGINRTHIARGNDGEFQLTYISNWRLLLFLLLRVNVYSKIIYLLLLFNNYVHASEELDFFTRFGIIIWLVTTSVTIYSDYYYMSKYPCFEALCSFWNVQSEIFHLLSSERREEFRNRLDFGARFRSTFHLTMSSIAMVGLGLQYVMDPKGILFTGSLVDEDESVVTTIFLGFIEEFFLYATWTQAVSVILVNVLAYRELTVVLSILAKEVTDLSLQRRDNKIPKTIHYDHNFLSDPRDNSRYTITLIFLEYRKLQIITDRLRSIMSPVLIVTIIIYFAQISSDVFVGIRLVRLEAYMDVGFYAADCCCGMLYWFVTLNSLSQLDTAFTNFHQQLKVYFSNVSDRQGLSYQLKFYKSLRHIAVYIGPSAVTRLTVGTCMITLVNYYILAAMW